MYRKKNYRESEMLWNGRELTGINETSDNYATKTAWRNMILSVYRQAVNDLEGIRRVGMDRIDGLDHLLVTEANTEEIEAFLRFESDISKFYYDFILSYNSLFDSDSDTTKL